MSRTYYLIIYDNAKPKGAINAMPSIIDEETANVLLVDAYPTIERKKEGMKFQVTQKRLFEYKNTDGGKTLFIVCDADRIKLLKDEKRNDK